MTKTQLRKALEREQERRRAESAARIVVVAYPYSHNPYVPHAPVEDCYAGCVRV